MRANGYNFLDVEPAPTFIADSDRNNFGYGMYSARYGNIYTSRQLLQLVQRAQGEMEHTDEHIWRKDAGFVDAFRPTIEPTPFDSVGELIDLRERHLNAVLTLIRSAGVFIFTMGLTESWHLKSDGAAFPVCPGTAGGEFDPQLHAFNNLTYPDVMMDMEGFFDRVRSINPNMKFILTVSPVPLMATATRQNVISATSYSKSVLRSVAGDLSERYDWVDYFPSFEIISSIPMRSQFYNADMRTVVSCGVEHVMKQFFKEHGQPEAASPPPLSEGMTTQQDKGSDDVRCDEELLEAFGPSV